MKKYILVLIISSFALLQCSSEASLGEISKEWEEVMETDSGFVKKSHYDNGAFFVIFNNPNELQIIADDKVEDLLIDSSIIENGTYKLDCSIVNENNMKISIEFSWKDKANEILEMTVSNDQNVLMTSFMSSVKKAKDYPTYIYGK